MRIVRAIVLAAGAAVAMGSCAGRPAAADRAPAAEAARTGPVGDLRRLAERQSTRPDVRAMRAPLPPGMEPRTVEPVKDNPDATVGLEAIAARLAVQTPSPSATTPPRDAEESLRLYARGREKLIQGDAAGAVKDLERATDLNAGAGEPWRELAEAQAAMGWRTDSIASFEKALAAGLADARVLERLGRHAFDKGDLTRAASLLSRASLEHPERVDPLLPSIIDLYLARSLAPLGYVAASREATIRAAQRSSQLSASTRYGEDYGAVFRRQGELWRDAGDASCRLGEFARAAEAYDRALSLPTIDGRDMTPRRVYATMKAGNPAAAALAVIDRVEAGADVNAETTELLRYMAANTDLGPRIRAAIEAHEATLPTPIPPTTVGSLARARAAADPATAAKTLFGHIKAHPWDSDTLLELLNLAADAPAASAVALDLVRAVPRAAERTAGTMLRSRHDADALSAAVRQPAEPAARLLASRLALARGLAGDAADLAAGPAPADATGLNLTLARLTTGLATDRDDQVREALPAIEQASGPDSAWCRMRMAAMFQRYEAALAEADADLGSGPSGSRFESLLVAAELAAALDRGDEAERRLLEALTIDPRDGRIAARLTMLYSSGGPKADPAKLNQVLRQVRREIPEARVLRASRIRDLLRRSMLEQAEGEAVRLAEEEPSDAGAMELAVTVWRARAARGEAEAIARGEAWLRAQLVRRPGSPEVLAGLATILVADGRSEAAEQDLRTAIDRGAPDEVRRMLEGLLRAELKRDKDADALTLARLRDRLLTPAESFELAELRLRHADLEQAALALRRGFPDGVAITREQGARLIQVLTAAADAGPEHTSSLLDLFDLAASRRLRLSVELHERRMKLLAEWPRTTADRMVAAAEDVLAQYPGLNDRPFAAATRFLIASGRGALGLLVSERAAARPGEHGPDLYAAWMYAAGVAGTVAHARSLVEHADRAGAIRPLIESLGEGTITATTDLKSQAAYMLGAIAAAASREEQAEAFYTLSLEYDAGHAWACNNLGYSLLERGKDLDRASDLLERAHAALPDEPSITDSLGWLRYKQGLIEDAGDDGERRPGAITLLQRAVDHMTAQASPTILDHLGDALWLGGRADQARLAWERAESAAHTELSLPRDPSRALSPSRVAELKLLRDRAAAKRLAAESGQRVRIAPTAADPDPQPPPGIPAEAVPANDAPRGGPRT